MFDREIEPTEITPAPIYEGQEHSVHQIINELVNRKSENIKLIDHFAGLILKEDSAREGLPSEHKMLDKARVYYKMAEAMVKVRKEFIVE